MRGEGFMGKELAGTSHFDAKNRLKWKRQRKSKIYGSKTVASSMHRNIDGRYYLVNNGVQTDA